MRGFRRGFRAGFVSASVRDGAFALALSLLAAPVGITAGMAADAPPRVAAEAAGFGPVTRLPLPRYVSMRAESANARRGPSLDQRVDWEFVRRGLPLEITAEYGNWRRVRDAEGMGGWVHHTLLSGARTALVLGPERATLLEEPRAEARVVGLFEPGVVARLEACQGDWCEIGAAGVEGWLPRATIWGVGPDETLE
mgnify:FL=1